MNIHGHAALVNSGASGLGVATARELAALQATRATHGPARMLMNVAGIGKPKRIVGKGGSPALLAELPQPVQESLAASIPFPKRLGKPEEFAELAAGIIRKLSLNGEVIRLDSALRLAPR